MTKSTAGSVRTNRDSNEVAVSSARETALVLAERVKNRDAQLRRSFVRRGKSTKPTPLMHMLRGGRGGEVRLKLFLSLLWVGVAAPHSASYPARTWAALLGLADPSKLGARRVSDALSWLADEQYVRLHGGRGTPQTVTLLDESGSGAAYTLPGARISQLSASGKPWTRHAYDKVPVAFWTNGWIGLLPGHATACFLVLLSTPQPMDEGGAWFSTSLLSERYDMSDDTRQRGMRELQRWGLVSARTEVLARTSLDFQRKRNMYYLDLKRLQMPPKLLPR